MANARLQGVWQRRSPALVTLAFVVLGFGFLYAARAVLIPTALTILLAFLLGPIVNFLQRRRVPRVPAVLIVVIAAGMLVGLLGWVFVAQTLSLINDLPKYQAKITERIEEVRGDGQVSLFGKVQSFVNRVVQASSGTKPSAAVNEEPQRVVVVNRHQTIFSMLGRTLRPLIAPIAFAALVVILLIYMLLEREELRDRLLRLIGRTRIPMTTMAIDDASRRISRYLLAQFLINVSFGVFIGVGLALLGLPYAILWAILAAFLRYIPVAGPWLAAILPVSLSLLTSNDWTQPILAILMFAAFEMAANLWIEPWIYGQTIGVSQTALLIAIAFWTWLWGPMGLVLAAPMTVCLMILGRYVPALKFFDILLGDEPPLTVDLRFYQRLLAHNQDEASQIAREQLSTLTLVGVYDQIIIPALTFARRDMDNGRLAAHEAEQVWQSSGEIAEELWFIATHSPSPTSPPVEQTVAVVSSLPRVRVLVCAARDRADQVGLEMLTRVIDASVCEMQTASADRLAAEIVSQVEQDHPSIVCIAALPPGGVAHTRLLCKRLRRLTSELKILVGRWGPQPDVEKNREELVSAGADFMGDTLDETSKHLTQLARFMRRSLADRQDSAAVVPLVPKRP